MTKKTQAVTVIEHDESALIVQSTRALNALRQRKVDRKFVSTHPGRGGKTFSYIDHAHVSDTLLDAFGPWFSHDVIEAHILEDNSTYALVRLTMHEPIFDEGGRLSHTVDTTITEVGTSPASPGGGTMDFSYRIASAASRGLVKCVARRFGYGLEFYRKMDFEQPTDLDAWNTCWLYYARVMNLASESKAEVAIAKNDLVAYLSDAGIDRDNILDRFQDAYRLTNDFINDVKGTKPKPAPKMEIEDVAEVEEEEVPAKAKVTPKPKHGGMTIDQALQHPMPNSAPKLDIHQGQAMLDAAMLGDKAKSMFAYLAQNNGQFGDASLAAEVILKNWDNLPELLHGDEEEVAAENLLDEAISRDEDAVPEDPFGGMLDF
jgi:hypothetical protein